VNYPTLEKELRIVRAKVRDIDARLADDVVRFIQRMRTRRLAKIPGVAESLDWARALVSLGADTLDEAVVDETLGCVLKDEADLRDVRGAIAERGLASFVNDA
jgi:MoxR-like ATPase